ncbi:MAG: trigger factor [Clostridiales bacterium]|jgi:trigger factor|nr:trigger factor [Clostridiales bacterium]
MVIGVIIPLMNYTVEFAKDKKCKIQFSLGNEEWKDALHSAYLEHGSKYKIQGFRPGKAPRGVIEQHYGSATFVEDAINYIFPKLYDQVLQERPDIDPVQVPKLDLAQVEPQVIFTAEFDIKPDVTLGRYQGNQVHDIDVSVDLDEINDYIRQEATKLSRKISVDRPVLQGDTVRFDFSGSVDGVKFDGGTAKDFELEIGSGQFIPGFEEQMVGMKVAEPKDIVVTFPAEYHQKSLAGKQAVFECLVHSISVNQVPELDDEFAKDVSVFDTFVEYKADVANKLQSQKQDKAKDTVDNNLLEIVVDNSQVDIPNSMVERQVDIMLRDFERMLSRNGLSIDSYLDMTKGDIKDLRAYHQPEALKIVKVNLVVEALIKHLDIQATDIDIANQLEHVAQVNNMTVEQVEQAIKDGHLDKDQVIYKSKLDKLQAYLRQHNTILPPLPKENKTASDEGQTGDTTKSSKKSAAKQPKDAKESKLATSDQSMEESKSTTKTTKTRSKTVVKPSDTTSVETTQPKSKVVASKPKAKTTK